MWSPYNINLINKLSYHFFKDGKKLTTANKAKVSVVYVCSSLICLQVIIHFTCYYVLLFLSPRTLLPYWNHKSLLYYVLWCFCHVRFWTFVHPSAISLIRLYSWLGVEERKKSRKMFGRFWEGVSNMGFKCGLWEASNKESAEDGFGSFKFIEDGLVGRFEENRLFVFDSTILIVLFPLVKVLTWAKNPTLPVFDYFLVFYPLFFLLLMKFSM